MITYLGGAYLGYRNHNGGSTINLTLPEGTTHIVVSVNNTQVSAGASIGGVALSRDNEGGRFVYGSIAGRANDTLSMASGDAYAHYCVYFLSANELGLVDVVSGTSLGAGGWYQTSREPAVDGANIWGCAFRGQQTGTSTLAPDDAQSYLVNGQPSNSNRAGVHVIPAGAANAAVTTGMTLGSITNRFAFAAFFEELSVVTTVAESFTVDAVIKKVPAGSLTVDAIVWKTRPGSLSVDAVIRTYPDSTLGELTLGRSGLAQGARSEPAPAGALSFKVDAAIKATVAGQFTVDAVIGEGGGAVEGSFAVDAVIRKTRPGSLSLDAVLLWARVGSFTADAVIGATVGGSFSLDAVIAAGESTVDGSFSLDAVLRKVQSSSFAIDAVIKRTVPNAFSTAAVLRRTTSATVTLDAVLKGARGASVTADAIIAKTAAGAITADAILGKTRTVGFDLDAVLSSQRSGSFSVDALIGVVREGSFTTDAVIRVTRDGSLDVDAVIGASQAGSFSVDALVFVVRTGAFTLDACISATRAGAFGVDAVISGRQQGSFSLEAIVSRTATGSFAVDAIVAKSHSGSFLTDAVLSKTTAGGLSLDAIVARTNEGSFQVSASLAGAFTIDALIFVRRTASFTIDALIRGVHAALDWVDATRFVGWTDVTRLVDWSDATRLLDWTWGSTMGPFFTGDTGPSVEATLHALASASDIEVLTGASVRFQMRKANDKTYRVNGEATIVNQLTGSVRYDWEVNDLNLPGTYLARWEITYADGVVVTTQSKELVVERQ